MVAYYPSISDNLGEWAMKQYVFFTASAPLNGKHVNLSPKGLASTTFTIFGPNKCGYVDATGSGNETISHIYENGRVTIMFCSFEKAPRILRFFCKGRVIEADSAEFKPTVEKMDKNVIGARAIILLDVFLVQTSCGFGVPLLNMKDPTRTGSTATNNSENSSTTTAVAAPENTPKSRTPTNTEGSDNTEVKKLEYTHGFVDRDTIGHWAGNKIAKNELHLYQAQNNARSLDGLPGMKTAMRANGDLVPLVQLKARVERVFAQRHGFFGGLLMGLLLYFLLNLVLLHENSSIPMEQLQRLPDIVQRAFSS